VRSRAGEEEKEEEEKEEEEEQEEDEEQEEEEKEEDEEAQTNAQTRSDDQLLHSSRRQSPRPAPPSIVQPMHRPRRSHATQPFVLPPPILRSHVAPYGMDRSGVLSVRLTRRQSFM
jgi:hypothetical protein